jgi:hypothetical protein
MLSTFAACRTVLQDLRYGLRTLARSPGFASAAVLSLALGIGINSAMLGIVNALLLRPIPVVKEPDRLLAVYQTTPRPFSHLWKRRFSSDAGVVGRTIRLNGAQFTVRLRRK